MTTTTTLVHRAYDGPMPWWREALVYECPSPALGPSGLDELDPLLDHVSDLGLTTILIRPAAADVMGDTEAKYALRRFTAAAHQRNLHVVVRVSGALTHITGAQVPQDIPVTINAERPGPGLMERVRSMLAFGADGIDFGVIVPPDLSDATDLSILSDYAATTQALFIEYMAQKNEDDEGIVGADVSTTFPDQLFHHLQDDWFHHLRDDALALAHWDVTSLRQNLTASLGEHDRFGAAATWRVMNSNALCEDADPGDGSCWFNTDRQTARQRALALQAMALALPGVIYVRQGDELGMYEDERPCDMGALAQYIVDARDAEYRTFGSPLVSLKRGLEIRRERRLATAPLAFVSGMEWAPDGALTFLSRDVLVLVNTTAEPIVLPEKADVMLSSCTLTQHDGRVCVPPDSSVWLESRSVR